MLKRNLERVELMIINMKIPKLSKFFLFWTNTLSLPNFFFIICFVISQLQIFLLILESIRFRNEDKSDGIMSFLLKFHQFIFFSKFGILDNFPFILVAMSCYFLLIFIAACYILIAIYKKTIPFHPVQRILGLIGYIHPLILFHPINYTSLQILLMDLEQEKAFLNGISTQVAQAIFILIIILNTIWSVFQTVFFFVNIKDKNCLSSKSFAPNLIDLFLKFIIPLICLSSTLEIYNWILLAINLTCCLIKDGILFRYLLYYNISTLYFSTIMNALLTSFAFAGFFSYFFTYLGSDHQQSLAVFIWMLLATFLAKVYIQSLHSRLLGILLFPNNIKNPYYLIHYLEVYKQFSKHSSLRIMAPKIRNMCLQYHTAVSQSEILNILSLDNTKPWTIKIQKKVNRYFLQKGIALLEQYIQKNPNINIVKAMLANYYMKSSGNMILVEHILSQNAESGLTFQNSFHLIRFRMIQKLTLLSDSNKEEEENKKGKNGLSIQSCLKIQETYYYIKKSIQEQLELQILFWNTFQSEKLEFLSLINQAKRVCQKSKSIEKFSTKMQFFVDAELPQMLLVLSLYFYLIQNEITYGQRLMFDYSKLRSITTKNNKNVNNKTLKSSALIKFASESLYFTVSMAPNALGRILNCYGTVKGFFGTDGKTLVGRSINSLMHPMHAKYHDQFLKEFFYRRELSVPHSTEEVHILLKTGYIMPCKIKMELNYLPGCGLCYFTLLKPITEEERRTVLLKENGSIVSFCRNFGLDMNIRASKDNSLNIYDFCPDLKENLDEELAITDNFMEKTSSEHFNDHSISKLSQTKLKSTPSQVLKHSKTHILDNRVDTKDKNICKKKIVLDQNNLSFVPQTKKLAKGILPLVQNCVMYNVKVYKYLLIDTCMIELQLEKLSSDQMAVSPIKEPLTKESQFGISKIQGSESFNSENIAESLPPSLPIQSPFTIGSKETKTDAKPAKNLVDSSNNNFPEVPKSKFNKRRVTVREDHISVDESFENEDSDKFEDLMQSCQDIADAELKETPGMKKIEIKLINKYFENNFLGESNNSVLHAEKAIESHKTIRKVLKSKKVNKMTILYNYSFIITFACLLTFLIWLNFQTSTTSRDLESNDLALQNAYFRNYWLKLANQETRIWVACNMGLFDLIDTSVFVETMNKSYHMLNMYNHNLQVSLANIDTSIQEAFYRKDVKIYERRNDQTFELISIDNTFQIIRKIINDGIKNVQKPLPEEFIDSLDPETQFIFDNSLNELLIISEGLILLMKDNILKILSDAENVMLVVLLIALLVLVVFILFSLYFVFNTNRDSENLMRTLFRLPMNEVMKTERLLTKFNDLLSKDCQENDFIQALNIADTKQENVKSSKEIYDAKSLKKQTTSRVSMRQTFTRNYLIFFGILALFSLQVGFMFIYYNQATDKILLMKRHHSSMDTALDYLNSIALTSVQAQAVIVDNGTSTTRNIPIFESSRENFKRFKKISELQVNLQKDETISPYEQEVFMNISCQNIYSPLYSLPEDLAISECIDLSNGLGRVGLINMLSRLPVEVNQVISDFESSNRDKEAMTISYNAFFNPSFLLIDTSSALILLLFSYVTYDFEILIKQLEDERVILAWVALIVSFFLGSVMRIFFIKSLLSKEYEHKLLLTLIPNKLILKSWGLKKILKNFEER